MSSPPSHSPADSDMLFERIPGNTNPSGISMRVACLKTAALSFVHLPPYRCIPTDARFPTAKLLWKDGPELPCQDAGSLQLMQEQNMGYVRNFLAKECLLKVVLRTVTLNSST